jgi:hypothetical protein
MRRPLLLRLLQLLRPARPKPASHRPLFVEPLEDRRLMSVWSAAENLAYFGTLNQRSLDYSYPQFGTGDGNMSCGPSAATNSLVYLQNAFPDIYGHSLIAAAGRSMTGSIAYTTYDDWIYTAGGVLASAKYMDTTQANGTYHDDFIQGLYNYTRTASPGTLCYSAQDYWATSSWGGQPAGTPPSWVSGVAPTWNYLYGALNRSDDVLALFSYVRGGGHYVSIEGMTWNDVQGSGTVTFMDPWTGTQASATMYLASGKIYTSYGGSAPSWISALDVLVPVRPVPPPPQQSGAFGGSLGASGDGNQINYATMIPSGGGLVTAEIVASGEVSSADIAQAAISRLSAPIWAAQPIALGWNASAAAIPPAPGQITPANRSNTDTTQPTEGDSPGMPDATDTYRIQSNDAGANPWHAAEASLFETSLPVAPIERDFTPPALAGEDFSGDSRRWWLPSASDSGVTSDRDAVAVAAHDVRDNLLLCHLPVTAAPRQAGHFATELCTAAFLAAHWAAPVREDKHSRRRRPADSRAAVSGR